MDKLLESFSDIAHDSWSKWTDYFLKLGQQNADGTVTIPADKVARWQRQIETPYADLSEKEKESDRIEARKYLNVLRKWDQPYNPWERLMMSRKFWLLVGDTVISLVFHLVGVIKPEALEHVKFAVLALQPVFVVIITAIAVEDAASNLASK